MFDFNTWNYPMGPKVILNKNKEPEREKDGKEAEVRQPKEIQ